MNDSNYGGPLHYAAAIGNTEMVKLLLNRKSPVDAPTSFAANTPLHFAAANGTSSSFPLFTFSFFVFLFFPYSFFSP
jgi:ankyrin repeat protein